jgi:hypothetical protein
MTKENFDNLCSALGNEYVYNNLIKPELKVDDKYSQKNGWYTYFKQSNVDTNFLYIVAVPMVNGITTFVKAFDKTEWDQINVIYFKKLQFKF